MDTLMLLPPKSNFYAYRNAPMLPGKLRGAVVLGRVYERVLAAEDYLRRLDRNAKLIVLDSFRPAVMQATLFLKAVSAVATMRNFRNIGAAATEARSYARNPAIDRDAEHMSGCAVDLVLADPKTGRPFPEDLARYDSWSNAMKPGYYQDYAYVHMDRPDVHRWAAAASREHHIREACKKVGFSLSNDEFCQVHAPDSPHWPFEILDLKEFMVAKDPYGFEADLMERCERVIRAS